jgi:predicted O-methyltransferase YrrM
MWPIELGWLYDELAFSKSHAEIGTYCGRSLLASCGGMSDAYVLSVDNHSVDMGIPIEWVKAVKQATLKLIPESINVTEVIKSSVSQATICRVAELRFDSVFIDGCHELAECRADIEAWLPLVKPGGIICGHDYWGNNPGVMTAVNSVLRDFEVFEGSRIWFKRVTQ